MQIFFAAFWTVLSIFIVATAVMRGGITERLSAVVAILSWFATIALLNTSHSWLLHRSGMLIIDLVAVSAFCLIAARSRYIWPLVVTGFELCGVCVDVAAWASPASASSAYFVALQITSSAVLLTIAYGVLSNGFNKPDSQPE